MKIADVFTLFSKKGKKESVGKLQPKKSHVSFWNSGPGSSRKEGTMSRNLKLVMWIFADAVSIF